MLLDDIRGRIARNNLVPFIPDSDPPQTYTLWNAHLPGKPIEFVYFVYSGGRIKIGYSNGVKRRHAALSSHSPLPMTLILLVPGTIQDEGAFHKRFAEERCHGEWFAISKRMRNFFRARLCPVGRTSLKQAEVEFAEYCAGLAPSLGCRAANGGRGS